MLLRWLLLDVLRVLLSDALPALVSFICLDLQLR